MFFLALARGQCRFDDHLVRNLFRSGYRFIQKCYFMFKEQSSCIWTVSNKTYMMYFATKYLNHAWSQLKSNKRRQDFLRNTFCLKGCTGDWVFAENLEPRLYYVGLIPEIVLQFRPPYILETATFQMHHDVQFARLRISQAFESVILLSRVYESNLSRFGFRDCKEEHVKLMEVFDKLRVSLAIADYKGNLNFHYNGFENNVFTKILMESVGEPQGILQAVCRANATSGLIDRIYFDFSFCILSDVFDLITRLMSPCVKGLDLARVAMYQEYDEFVFTLLGALLHAETLMPVYVTCCGYMEDIIVPQKHVTFKIFTCSSSKTRQVEVAKLSFSSDTNVCQTDVYRKDIFWQNKNSIKACAEDVRSSTSHPIICVNLANARDS